MKRVVSVAIVVGLAALATSCGGQSKSGEDSRARVELTLLASNAVRPALERMITGFERANPDSRIKATFVPATQRNQLLLTQLKSGNAADIFVTSTGNFGPTSPFQLGSQLLDLSGSSWIRDIPKPELEAVTYRGKVVAYPAFLTAAGVMYNKDLFDQFGWRIPTTTTELLSLCRQIRAKGKTPMIVPGADTLAQIALLSANESYVFAGSPNWLDLRNAGKDRFVENADWRASLQSLLEMKDAGCFSPDAAGTTLAAAFQQMADGAAPMFAITTGQMGSVLAVDRRANLAMFPFPGATASDRFVGTAAGLTLGINAKTHHPEKAKSFLNFLAEPKQATLVAKLTGGISYRDASNGNLPDTWSLLAPLFKDGKFAPLWDVLPPNPNFFAYATTAMQGLLTEQLTVDQILRKFDELWDNPTATP